MTPATQHGRLLRGSSWSIDHEPLLTARDRRFFWSLLEHPQAPLFNYATGDHLSAEGLEEVRQFRHRLFASEPVWQPGQLPPWMDDFLWRCYDAVPHYNAYGLRPFAQLPSLRRETLRDASWTLVPVDLPLDKLHIYKTSGTTGTALPIPGDAASEACYVPLLEKVLARYGLDLEGGSERVSIVQVAAQERTLVYPAVMAYLGGAGFVKVNLNPKGWSHPDHRLDFLRFCNPEIFTGTPLSYAVLAELPVDVKPKALFCTSMSLLPALKARLEQRFDCPVIDLYSMSECRAVAAQGRLISADVYVEILDPQEDRQLSPGQRGEITLTGGRNSYFPLLRYRTGDHGALQWRDGVPYLTGLEGRRPVRFRTAAGRWLDNIDVTHAVAHLPLSQFEVHQSARGNLRFRYRGIGVAPEQVRQALRGLLGPGLRLLILDRTEEPLRNAKWISFTSDLADPLFS